MYLCVLTVVVKGPGVSKKKKKVAVNIFNL